MEKWLGQDVPKLGFGMMRLPLLPDGEIDIAQVERMVDAFLGAGFSYIDTAYGYLNQRSEPVVGRTVVARYPRERFQLATKLPLWLLNTPEDMHRIFEEQMARTGAGYFDYYLLHSFGGNEFAKLDALDAWDFIRRLKAEGRVKHIGASFHDTADVLDRLLTEHPELEFVQLQINYADWDDPKVQSRLCYETAVRHGKPVVIMEPVKGGSLAQMPQTARDVLTAAASDASVASWAMRYVLSLDHVITVLSGMSDMAQIQDNIHTVRDMPRLTDADRETIDRVRSILADIPITPCTECKYCVESGNCPQDIPIPGIIWTRNTKLIYDKLDQNHYNFITRGHGKASGCIRCGACESRCPQHLPIMELMEKSAALFG